MAWPTVRRGAVLSPDPQVGGGALDANALVLRPLHSLPHPERPGPTLPMSCHGEEASGIGTLPDLPLPPSAIRHSLSGWWLRGGRAPGDRACRGTWCLRPLSRVHEPPAGSPQGDIKPTTQSPGRVRCQGLGDSAPAQGEVRARSQQGQERTQCLHSRPCSRWREVTPGA